jgi:hypothetical protein
MSPASVLFTAIAAATFFACSATVLPAVAATNDYNNDAFCVDSPNPITAITRSVSSSSSSSTTVSSLESLTLNSNSNSMEQDLIKTLKAPTEDQPQIPFPGTTTREAATSTAKSTKQKQPKKKIATASENQQFILPAQISIEKSSSSPPSQERPYNGADVLVLQVWTDRPSSDLSPSVASDTSPKIIGGAQIPIGAIGGNFPVRFSLGPLNSVVGKEEEWKSLSSSKDLWLRASICRDNDISDYPETINTNSAASSSSLAPCTTSGTPILEGMGFSKWINFNNIQQQQQDGGSNADSSRNDKIGIRAPATVVLTTATATAASPTK